MAQVGSGRPVESRRAIVARRAWRASYGVCSDRRVLPRAPRAQDAKDAQTLMELRDKLQMQVTYMGMVRDGCGGAAAGAQLTAPTRFRRLRLQRPPPRGPADTGPPPRHPVLCPQVQQQQRRAAMGIRRAQLTLDELQALPEAAPMYRSVGKA